MQKNKVIQVLKSFSPKEMREADKFVRSPIHNNHEHVTLLFQYFRKHLNGSIKAFQRERVFDFLYPSEEFDMAKVHHVNSYLLKVLEEYLSWKEWKKNESDYGLQLMRAYSSHKLDGQFKNALKKSSLSHQSQELRDAQFFQFHYQFQFEEYNFARRLGRMRDFNLQELSDAQDIAFLVDKLKNACLLLSHQAVTKTTYDTRFLAVILDFLRGSDLMKIPAIAMYYHGFMALSDITNESSFLELKTLLVKQKSTIQISELRDLYILAINFCIRKLNSDDQSYQRELFDIYEEGLKINVFIDNGELSPFTYKNYVQSGLKLKEFDQVDKFIHDYKKFLPDHQREKFFNLNLAWLNYGKKDYRNAMQLLLRMDLSKDVLTACAVRTLLARMLYEQDEFDSLSSHLQSFQVFLNRKKALAYHRDRYMEFIKLLRKLLNHKMLGRSNKEPFEKEIMETKVVAKEWLLEQLEK